MPQLFHKVWSWRPLEAQSQVPRSLRRKSHANESCGSWKTGWYPYEQNLVDGQEKEESCLLEVSGSSCGLKEKVLKRLKTEKKGPCREGTENHGNMGVKPVFTFLGTVLEKIELSNIDDSEYWVAGNSLINMISMENSKIKFGISFLRNICLKSWPKLIVMCFVNHSSFPCLKILVLVGCLDGRISCLNSEIKVNCRKVLEWNDKHPKISYLVNF